MNRMVPCPGCHTTISVDAAACPHCGQPSATRTKPTAIVLGVILIVGLGLLYAFMVTH